MKLLSALGLDVFARSWATTWKVVASLLIKTAAPVVLTATALPAWKAGAGFGWLWLLFLLLEAFVWLRLTIIEQDAASPDRVMSLRRALLAVRRLIRRRTDAAVEAAAHPSTEFLRDAFDPPVFMSQIMAGIFYVVSAGNSDLNRHFRVTFMEPHRNELRITSYYNSDMDRPQTMARGYTFAKGQGVAGKSWELGETVVVADVEADQRSATPVFVALTPAHKRYRIQSLVSLPVFSRDSTGERLIGVLNVDSDRANHFSGNESALNELEILLRPFVQFIQFAFAVAQVASSSTGSTRSQPNGETARGTGSLAD